MFHGPSRPEAIDGMIRTLSESRLCGPPTNIGFVKSILQSPEFAAGHTLTSFLNSFKYTPAAIDVIKGGAYTLVQDYPGRPSVGKGIPHSGPMDSLAFQIANIIAGNPAGLEGLEITLDGPKLLFLGAAVVSLCGAPFDVTLDGKPFPMWTRVKIEAGQELNIGKATGDGCRAYLAVLGGFPTIAKYFGSKSTSPMVNIGGYQGRQLAPGDLISIAETVPESVEDVKLPENLRPQYSDHYEINAMVGPYDEGYLTPEDIEMIYETKWKISHNASRSGIRLIGPVPKWARSSGGEGGAHPSNLIEYGYPLGTLNWTGDDPCLFPYDSPDFGGFVSSTTAAKAEWSRIGQLKPGNTMQYKRISLEESLLLRQRETAYIKQIEELAAGKISAEQIQPMDYTIPESSAPRDWGKALIHIIAKDGHKPQVQYRQAGEDFLLVEYGEDSFDLNNKCRATALNKALKESTGEVSFANGLIKTMGCCNSLMVHYDGSKIPQKSLLSHLIHLETQFGDLSEAKVPSRRFRLPIAFDNERQAAAIRRYMETQRPYAPYLPDNMTFVAETNGLKRSDLERIYLDGSFMAVAVGFLCANTVSLPVDPRHRMSAPKQNPSRVFTPEGSLSWGGSCMSLYPVDSPGGYQMTGLTIPCFDLLGSKAGYAPDRPWLYEDFDQLTFYLVPEAKLEEDLARFRMGTYEYEWEEVVFDMKEHNELLRSTADEVLEMKRVQAAAQAEMAVLEKESVERWKAESQREEVSGDVLAELLADPAVESIQAPLNANVWKVLVKEGDVLESDQTVAILEAMKLEINVKVEADLVGRTVEMVVVKPGDSVSAGDVVLFARKK
jgi:urea carboxylase